MYLPWVIGFHSFNPFHAGLQDESAKKFKQNKQHYFTFTEAASLIKYRPSIELIW